MKYSLFLLQLLLSLSCPVFSDENPQLDKYFEYLHQYPKALGPLGNAEKGEIEIIVDRSKIAEIEINMGRKVGVMAEDKYWLWINDAVRFPSGKDGVYGRLIWKISLHGTTGVAVMAILPSGKVVLNRNYRHATRSWEYELPRGALNKNETPEVAAGREVKEETGKIIDDLVFLGDMIPDSGLTSTVVPVFLATVIDEQASEQEESEAIAGIEAFSVEELRRGFRQGQINNVPLRDPFLTFALFQAEIRDLLPKAAAPK